MKNRLINITSVRIVGTRFTAYEAVHIDRHKEMS